MKNLKQHWFDKLKQHHSAGYWRQRKTVSSRCGTAATVDQQSMLNFASNDYLNLATAPRVIDAFTRAAAQYGVGSGASPAVTGYSEEQALCEQSLGAFFQVDKACIFSSGYLSNLGLFSALFDAKTTVYMDRFCHASLIDACKLAGVRLRRYRHNDITHCRELMENDNDKHPTKVIVTEGVFSAQGDLSPLPALRQLADEFDAMFIVDDTHGIGVLGEYGRGTLEHYHMTTDAADVVIGTFGKALGGAGGFILCDSFIHDMLTQLARTLMFNTALPPAIFAAMRESLRIVEEEPERQQALKQNINYFHQQAVALNFPIALQPAAVQIITIGDEKLASLWQQACLQKQMLIGMLRYPTVPKGQACCRISISSAHQPSDIQRLLQVLVEVREKHAIHG